MAQPLLIQSTTVDDGGGAGDQVRVFTASRLRYQLALQSAMSVQPSAATSAEPTEGDTTRLVAVADPISWAAIAAWIAEKLAEAAIAAVLSAVVNVLFGKKVNLEKVLRQIVEEFARLVGEKLKEQQLRETVNGLRALQLVLEAYAAAPESYDTTSLHMFELESQKLFASASDLGVQGIGALTLAASIRSAIYAETATRARSDQLWEVHQKFAGQLATLIPELTEELVKKVSAQFGPVQRWERMALPDAIAGDGWGEKPGREIIVKFFYTHRGQKVFDSDDEGIVAAHRQRAMKSTIDRAIADVIVPADAVAQQLDLLRQKRPPWRKK